MKLNERGCYDVGDLVDFMCETAPLHSPLVVPPGMWRRMQWRVEELLAWEAGRRIRNWNEQRLLLGLVGEWRYSFLAGMPFRLDRTTDGGRDFGDTDVKCVPYFDTPLLNRLVDDPFKAAYYALCAAHVPTRRVRYVGWATRRELQSAPIYQYGHGNTYTLRPDELRDGLPPREWTE